MSDRWGIIGGSIRTAVLGLCAVGGLVAWPHGMRAQLIDPNRNCVYLPGSTNCQPIKPPAPPQNSGPPYQQFLQVVANSRIDIRLHPTYTAEYFSKRANLFCNLLSRGEMMKLTQEVSFPPVVNFTETTQDRSRLETAILRVGTTSFCPAFWPQEQQWEGTYVR